ncbi:MAG: hypothetical protein RLZZ314_1070 [Bacteroidota bacterium]|jgi:outer membrane protein OmpA-like peptidoglycan-associated protein
MIAHARSMRKTVLARRLLVCTMLASGWFLPSEWCSSTWAQVGDVPVKRGSKEGTLVVNYYSTAPDPELERLRDLAVEALGIHLRGVMAVGEGDIGWDSSPKQVVKELERIVSDLMRIRHFEEQSVFKGFSPEMLALVIDFEELDFRDVDRMRNTASRGFEERLYVLVEQRVQEILLQASVELGRFVNRGLLQKIGTVEQSVPASTFEEWMNVDLDAPLKPIEVDFNVETMSLLDRPDESAWPTQGGTPTAQDELMDMMSRILGLMEAQERRISALESGGTSRGLEPRWDTEGTVSTLARDGWTPNRTKPDQDPELAQLNLPQTFDIRFNEGSSRLTLTAQLQLNEVMEFMTAYPQLRVVCTGHADASGDRTANLSLSKTRAKAAQEYLLESGVEPTRVLLNFFGEERATNRGALDRRVEVAFFVRDSRSE